MKNTQYVQVLNKKIEKSYLVSQWSILSFVIKGNIMTYGMLKSGVYLMQDTSQ